MAGQQAFLMRAFRAANGSYHTWRAGQYDPAMAEATGPQAPPFPVGGYSDFMVLSFLGGPLARSDLEALPLPGMGTVGVPIAFPLGSPPLVNTNPGLDCQDFTSVSLFVHITTPGTASLATLFAAWSGVEAAAFTVDAGIQRSDDAILAGVSPQNIYQATFPMPPPTGPGPVLGPFNVPVRGRRLFLALQMDTNDSLGYVTALRLA